MTIEHRVAGVVRAAIVPVPFQDRAAQALKPLQGLLQRGVIAGEVLLHFQLRCQAHDGNPVGGPNRPDVRFGGAQ